MTAAASRSRASGCSANALKLTLDPLRQRLGVEDVLELNLLATGGLLPDRTFVLAVEPGTSAARVGAKPDRIEREDAAFHERVARGYEELADLFPDRVVVLDGSLDADALAERIQGELQRVG